MARRRYEDDDYYDDEPQPRRRRPDRYDDDDRDFDGPPRKKSGGGTVLVIVLTVVGLVLAGLGVGGYFIFQKVGSARARMSDANNLKQIGIAMHNHHDSKGQFPPQAIMDKDGKPVLSWRVAILPYIEQENLYRQFKLDEPWDSPTNKQLIPMMPRTYMIPGKDGDDPQTDGNTYYQVFVGEETPFWPADVPPPADARFDPFKDMTFASITDGTSNTIMVAEARKAVPWTKPEDIPFSPGVRPAIGEHFSGGTNVAFCDGSVRFIRADVSDETLQRLIMRNDGQVINDDF